MVSVYTPMAQRGINVTPSQGVEIICSLKLHCIFSLYYSDYLQGYKQIYPPPDSQSQSSFTVLYSINLFLTTLFVLFIFISL